MSNPAAHRPGAAAPLPRGGHTAPDTPRPSMSLPGNPPVTAMLQPSGPPRSHARVGVTLSNADVACHKGLPTATQQRFRWSEPVWSPRRNRTGDPILTIDAPGGSRPHAIPVVTTQPPRWKAAPRVGTGGIARRRAAWFLANLWHG